jgi:hypothetical protein
MVVPVDQLRRVTAATDASNPIWVDDADTRPSEPPSTVPIPVQAESDAYTGDFMREEAERFAQYVAARLGELHRKRLQMAEAENRFESITIEQKQEISRFRVAVAAESERLKEVDAMLQLKAGGLESRESALSVRESEVAAREARVARAEARATETDRRTADLRAAIDLLDVRRAALTDERAALDRRAELLDRAELAQHRRAAELDELDERLRLEQEEFEREMQAHAIRSRAG